VVPVVLEVLEVSVEALHMNTGDCPSNRPERIRFASLHLSGPVGTNGIARLAVEGSAEPVVFHVVNGVANLVTASTEIPLAVTDDISCTGDHAIYVSCPKLGTGAREIMDRIDNRKEIDIMVRASPNKEIDVLARKTLHFKTTALRAAFAAAAICMAAAPLFADIAMPEVVSHRGESNDRPENTMAAFRLAFERGVDGVECDVYCTSDGVPVIIHRNATNAGALRSGSNTEFSEDMP